MKPCESGSSYHVISKCFIEALSTQYRRQCKCQKKFSVEWKILGLIHNSVFYCSHDNRTSKGFKLTVTWGLITSLSALLAWLNLTSRQSRLKVKIWGSAFIFHLITSIIFNSPNHFYHFQEVGRIEIKSGSLAPLHTIRR